jgi:hypothetical protein
MLQKIILCALALGILYSTQAQSKTRTGRDYAVFFYVTDFQPDWKPLPETKPEAENLEKELTTNFGFTCELVSNPKRKEIRDKIRAYNALLTPNDQVLFFFSMHGHYVSTRDRGYLIGKDGLLNDQYGDTWFAYDDLRSDLDGCKAQHILLLLDACHSGSFGIRNKSVPDEPIYNQTEDCQTKVANTMKYVGRQYCTSGNKNAKTPAKSLFAARLLESLRKGGEKDVLRFDDLEYWIGKVENPKPESGSFSQHEPGGDFVFVRKNACGTTSPDSDGDGVPDNPDKCPTIWGSGSDGCSFIPEDNTAADLAAWRKAKQLDTEEVYREYLKQFKEPEFKEQANTALRRLEASRLARLDDAAYELAKEKNNIDAYKKYKANWPTGRHIAEANQKINKPENLDKPLGVSAVSLKANEISKKNPTMKRETKSASKTDELQICFVVEPTEGVGPSTQEFHFQIIDPTQTAIGSSVASDKSSGNEYKYTLAKAVNYDGASAQVCSFYKSGEFMKGSYVVNVWNKGVKIGSATVTLNK